MKTKITLAFIILALTACAPAATPAVSDTDIQNTAIAVQTNNALTQEALSTATPVPPTFTPTATIVAIPPTPPPTQPHLPILTPDAIQVERWKEYQTELAKGMFAADNADPIKDSNFGPEEYKDALCEWDILGEEKQVVFVYAVCIALKYFYFGSSISYGAGSIQNLAAIFLETDGSIRNVVVPTARTDAGTLFQHYDLHLFPLDVQKKLCLYYFYNYIPECFNITSAYKPFSPQYRLGELYPHLFYRISHLEEPPLVILSATPIATPTPYDIFTSSQTRTSPFPSRFSPTDAPPAPAHSPAS